MNQVWCNSSVWKNRVLDVIIEMVVSVIAERFERVCSLSVYSYEGTHHSWKNRNLLKQNTCCTWNSKGWKDFGWSSVTNLRTYWLVIALGGHSSVFLLQFKDLRRCRIVPCLLLRGFASLWNDVLVLHWTVLPRKSNSNVVCRTVVFE